MPSNKELSSSIRAISPELSTDRLNNAQLAKLLADLKAKQRDISDEMFTAARDAEYHVAEGVAITTLRGILADGAQIRPSDLVRGDADLEALIKAGHVL